MEPQFLKHDVLQVLGLFWNTSYTTPIFAAVLKAALNSLLSNYSLHNGWDVSTQANIAVCVMMERQQRKTTNQPSRVSASLSA
jgi:hypothetical protein